MYSHPYSNMMYFQGVVENRLDPLKIGRVQVRVFGIHTDNVQSLPSEDLHWFSTLMPVTSASTSGVGQSPNLVEGSHVFGVWLDGDSHQNGLVMGSINGIPQQSRNMNKGFNDQRTNLTPTSVPGKPSAVTFQNGIGASIVDINRTGYPSELDTPDINPLATGENLTNNHIINNKKNSRASNINVPSTKGTTFSEPDLAYNAIYPYNNVIGTESGHAFELDDTPAHERININHRSGSFNEFRPDGTVVNKSVKDNYDITHANDYEYVQGTKTVTVAKGAKLLVNSSNGGDGFVIEIGSGGNLELKVTSGSLNIDVTGDLSTKVSGDYSIQVGGKFGLKAQRIDLN